MLHIVFSLNKASPLLQAEHGMAQASTHCHREENHGKGHGDGPKGGHFQAIPQEDHQDHNTDGGVHTHAPHRRRNPKSVGRIMKDLRLYMR